MKYVSATLTLSAAGSWRVLLFVLALLSGATHVEASEATHTPDAMLGYPVAGDYELHRIFKAPDHLVLEDSVWSPKGLNRYTTGKITLLSFFYSTCRDPAGCPVLWSLFTSVHEQVKSNPELHEKVRLVFVSLDPRVDTPSQLEVFAQGVAETRTIAAWHFLTTWSVPYLQAILDSFSQSAARDTDHNGRPMLTISHQVKIYLFDKKGWVREIYVSNAVSPEMIETDIRTLLIESGELARR